VVGQALTFTGATDAFPLPSGVVANAASLTVDVTFRTTQGGVLLGYQNQAAGTTPTIAVPALYVGTDGKLYAALYNGAINPIKSAVVVNDGLTHHAVLVRSGSTLTLTLDGTKVGTLSGPFSSQNMTFNQLGTGYTGGGWPAGNSGYDPFVGVIDKLTITTSTKLTSAVITDQSFSDLQDGIRYLYQVSSPSGGTALAGNALSFTGSDSIPLPKGLVNNAKSLTVDVTFRTMQGGVLLGYQNQPAGTTPTNYVPALYVGSDGRLYAEIYNNRVDPMQSSTTVNDGHTHHAVLTLSGSTLTLTLDGVKVGSLTGPFHPLDMTFAQLGTGYTDGVWPGGATGYDPFVGTIDKVAISTDPVLPASMVQPGQWQVSVQSGQTVLTAPSLTFGGTSAIPLPSGLINGATGLTVNVTFQTTKGGVILGYQNEAVTGPAPGNAVPGLYVGTDGLLYAELFNGIVAPIHSAAVVNDNKAHVAVLTLSGSTLTLTLDGVVQGTLSGPFNPLDMAYNQLGTGYTASWPGGNGGYDNFIGTLSKLVITTNASLAPSASVGGSTAGQLRFTPPDSGNYVFTQYSTGPDGRTATTSRTLNSTDIAIKVSVGTSTTAVQGATFSRSGSFTDAAGDGPWTATVDYGDGSGALALTLAANKTFALSHVYQNAGMFNVIVTVKNADGISTQGTVAVSVSGFTVNDGSQQQSMVRSLTYTFASPSQVEPGAFELLRNGKRTNIKLVIAPQADGMTYLITFKGPEVIGGSLPDGKYTLITLHDKVNVLSGAPMTEDDVNTFARLFGDVNADGIVNAADRALLHQAEADRRSPYAPDFEYDGKPFIDKFDIAQFNARYGTQLNAPKKAPAKFPGRAGKLRAVGPHHLGKHGATRIGRDSTR
jgi:hypothetical protein